MPMDHDQIRVGQPVPVVLGTKQMENGSLFAEIYIKEFSRSAGLIGMLLTQRWDLVEAWAREAVKTIDEEKHNES